MRKGLWLAVVLAGLAAAGFTGLRLLRAGLEADVYRLRLEELAQDHELLRQRYDAAVRRTAVTELRVRDGRLRLAIRDAAGRERVFDTPFDPADEIYVDYVVLDGRLWIRRVFDSATPPREALVVDPELAEVDWSRAPDGHGKAAYRALAEGRWVVSVSGDGSLGLARVPEGEAPRLAPPPPVRRFEPVEEAVDDRLAAIRPAEALRALALRLRPGG